jgi:acetyl-CoA carboxylase carboxyl transferase subunit alpha
MDPNFLDFEQPITELQAKISELRYVTDDSDINISQEIQTLERKTESLTNSIFGKLTAWQISQLSRHPNRPYSQDYIDRMFTDFEHLHGDRTYGDDHPIIGGVGRLEGKPVMVIGQQKGRDTREKIKRNFGMPRPEGYRKALRLMKMAEKFKMPLITLVDTPGAYPGIGAEERGQSEAIARNLFALAELKIPVVCTVIGEGGSGGALAICIGDRINMLQYSTYSVISPEGCASILWKSADKASLAAEAMGITAQRLFSLNLIDNIIQEPLGAAHRDYDQIADSLQQNLIQSIDALESIPIDKLLEQRYQKLMSFGQYREG